MACPRCGVEPTGCLCVLSDTDCYDVAGDGSDATPFTLSPVIAPADNVLTCGADGLTGALPSSIRVPPSCQLTSTVGGQSIPATSNAIIQFNSVVFDTNGMASLANNRIIINTPGVYVVTMELHLSPASASGLGGSLLVNGTLLIGATVQRESPATDQITTTFQFAASDFLQLLGTNASASPVTVVKNASSPFLSASLKRVAI